MALLLFTPVYGRGPRGRLYAIFSTSTKSAIAAAFLSKAPREYGLSSAEEYLSFFSNKVTMVLRKYYYLGLFELKLLFQFALVLITLLIISWQTILAIAPVMLAFTLVIRFSKEKLEKGQEKLQENKTAFMKTIVELHNGYEEIHLNQMERLAERDFDESNLSSEQALYHYRLSQYKIETLGIGQNMLIYSMILIIGGLLAYSGKSGVGVVVSVAGLSVQLLNEWALLSRFRVVRKGVEGLKKEVEAFLHTEPSPEQSPRENTDKILVLVDVSFGYEEENPILKDLNFDIQKGKKYLLSGNSGTGKSTLLELLAGHLEPQTGQIISCTDKVAYVPQTPFLFPGTLRENIVFEQEISDDEILEVLQKLELNIPLDYVVEEKGSNLSGGQKVRVVLARALLSQPDLLITDELTANLDKDLGSRIEQMLLNEYPWLTVLSVAHRTYYPESYDAHLHLSANGLEGES